MKIASAWEAGAIGSHLRTETNTLRSARRDQAKGYTSRATIEGTNRTNLRTLLPLILMTIAVFTLNNVVSAQATQRQYLSGPDGDAPVPWELFCTSGAKSATLPVPSCWDMHRFGNMSYYSDARNRVPEQGIYLHAFAVPQAWEGRRLFLVFEGAMTDTQAEVNGKLAGPVHQGGYYRVKYDVTALVRAGARRAENAGRVVSGCGLVPLSVD